MRPNPALGIHDVRQRLFRGFCAHNDRLEAALDTLEERRSELEALFRDPEMPHAQAREQSWSYVESFYDLLAEPRKVEREIYDRCRER